MTLRIVADVRQDRTTIRLIGRMRAEHIEPVRAEIAASRAPTVLDLDEVTLADIDAVRCDPCCRQSCSRSAHYSVSASAGGPRGTAMPMIDVYAPSDLLPSGSDRKIGEELPRAVPRAEGVSAPGQFHLENTAAFIHKMDPATVHTAVEAVARVIRMQIITPPGALTWSGQKQLVQDVTTILTDICGDPSQAKRTWVLLTEAAEGGWASRARRSVARNSPHWRRQRRRVRSECGHKMPAAQLERCSTTLMREYYDRERGVPTHDDRAHFEFLILEAAQAGLCWSIVLNKRDGYRRAFSQFDPKKVARYSPARIDKLTTDPGIVRNRMKIAAAVKTHERFSPCRKNTEASTRTAGNSSTAGHGRIGGARCARFPPRPPSRTHSAGTSSAAGSVSSDRR